jgi:hypothetical protein
MTDIQTHQQTIAALRADLARVTAERDSWRQQASAYDVRVERDEALARAEKAEEGLAKAVNSAQALWGEWQTRAERAEADAAAMRHEMTAFVELLRANPTNGAMREWGEKVCSDVWKRGAGAALLARLRALEAFVEAFDSVPLYSTMPSKALEAREKLRAVEAGAATKGEG